MTNLEILKNEYLQLCDEFDRASEYMHSIGRKIREKRQKNQNQESILNIMEKHTRFYMKSQINRIEVFY